MKLRPILFGLLTLMLASMKVSTAQDADRRTAATMHPCPGGTGSAEVDTVSPTSLDSLLRMSELILVGTVADVLPAFNTDPDHLSSIETHSLVAVNELLYGALPPGIRTIVLAQMGGKAGPCGLVVRADPLVQRGEKYLFFLWADERKQIPNTSGSPRYVAVGVWSGKAKVVNGKIQFLPSAHPALHEYDDMDVAAFIATVEDRLKTICQLFPCLVPRK